MNRLRNSDYVLYSLSFHFNNYRKMLENKIFFIEETTYAPERYLTVWEVKKYATHRG